MNIRLIILCIPCIFSYFQTHEKIKSINTTIYDHFTDSLPNVCNMIPPQYMKDFNPFTIPLSGIIADENNHETYSGCLYQFFTPDVKAQISIKLIKWNSKKEAGDDFHNFFINEWNATGQAPERISGVADSAYFNYGFDDTTKCDECSFVATIKDYGIYIAFKGEYEKVTRARKKESALKILQAIYDCIPGLAPSRIRNLQ